jgi:hypothetical protein
MKVKAGTPTPFVKDSGEIVIGIDELFVVGSAGFGVFGVQVPVGIGAVFDGSGTRKTLFLK